MPKSRITLKEAIANDKLEQFIKEREGETFNPAAFNTAIEKLVGKPRATPAASSPDSSASYSGKKTPVLCSSLTNPQGLRESRKFSLVDISGGPESKSDIWILASASI